MRLPAHSAGSSSTRTKAVSSVDEAVASTGWSAPSSHDSPVPVGVRPVRRLDRQLAEEQATDAGARVDMPVRDAAGREVDAIAAEQPVPLSRVHDELPDQRVPIHASGAEVGLVAREVVDDAIAGRCLDPVWVLGELQHQ